mgnify:CR=1 FL=1
MCSGKPFCFGKKVSSINSLMNQKKNKNLIRRMMLAVIAGCLMPGCIAFAGTVDIVNNFLGVVVSVIAKGLLNAADIVLEPLMDITTMSTADVSKFVPGFDSGSEVGNFFIQAINAIAYMIAGVLVCCHIISYLINLAHGEKVESIPKMIWNAVFGIVLVISGKTFLTIMFDEIVAPLSSALSEGVKSAGMSFSFVNTGSEMTGLGEITSAFDLSALATLLVVLVLMLIIWWNLIKLVLECAERYIICIFTINLSPLAFATMASENTKDTAINWLRMFWSQCVLLILNIWVVGIARTALNNSLFGASNTEMIKWGLITYAYLKIAQRLDDMMQTAGLKITRTTGLDPISEASGVIRSIGGIFGHVASFAGHVAGVGMNLMDTGKNIGEATGFHPIENFKKLTSGDETLALEDGNAKNSNYSNKNVAERVLGNETCADRKAKIEDGTLKADSYDTDAYKQVIEDKLRETGHLNDNAHVEKVEIGEDGKIFASAVERDKKNRISEKTDFAISDTKDGKPNIEGAEKFNSVQVAPNGKSVKEEGAKGEFGIRKVGEDAAGNQTWEAEHVTGMNGENVKDTLPDVDNKIRFTVPKSKIAEGRENGSSDAMIAHDYFAAGENGEASARDILSNNVENALSDKKLQDQQEQTEMANRINMTDEQRLADRMNPESNADYNSPNAFKAMEDHIKENAQYYPEQAEFLAKGGHVTGMYVSNGEDGNPSGSLVVNFENDQSGKNSKASCTFTRGEEPDNSNSAVPPTSHTDGQSKKEVGGVNSVGGKVQTPVDEKTPTPVPQKEGSLAPVGKNVQEPASQEIDNKKVEPVPAVNKVESPAIITQKPVLTTEANTSGTVPANNTTTTDTVTPVSDVDDSKLRDSGSVIDEPSNTTAPVPEPSTGSDSPVETDSSDSTNNTSDDTNTHHTSQEVESPAAEGQMYAVGEAGGSEFDNAVGNGTTEVVQAEPTEELHSDGATEIEVSGGSKPEPHTPDGNDSANTDLTDNVEPEIPATDGTQYYQDNAQTNSFTVSEQEAPESEPERVKEQKRPQIPEAYMTSQSSVTRLSDTNGTVESEDLGMFQMTRVDVADNGWTTWQILQKVDSDGSTPEYAPFKVHIKPVLDSVARKFRPATFDEVANKARNIKKFEDVGPNLDADYRRSQSRREFNKKS